jgi:hypothetical protein
MLGQLMTAKRGAIMRDFCFLSKERERGDDQMNADDAKTSNAPATTPPTLALGPLRRFLCLEVTQGSTNNIELTGIYERDKLDG